MALTILEEALGTRERVTVPRGWSSRGSTHIEHVDKATRVLDAVQTVVNVLTPPGGGRYVASFSPATDKASQQVFGATSMQEHHIYVTSLPLYTKGLRLSDAADVLVGFTVHEIGHTLVSDVSNALIDSKYKDQHPAWKTIKLIANLLDDVLLEQHVSVLWPGIAGTFRPAARFVAEAQKIADKPPFHWGDDLDYSGRVNFAVIATRYRWFARWSNDTVTRSERRWWIEWAARYASLDVNVREQGWLEAFDRIALNLPVEPKGKGEGPGGKPEESDDDDGPTQPTIDEPSDDGDDAEDGDDGWGDDDNDDSDGDDADADGDDADADDADADDADADADDADADADADDGDDADADGDDADGAGDGDDDVDRTDITQHGASDDAKMDGESDLKPHDPTGEVPKYRAEDLRIGEIVQTLDQYVEDAKSRLRYRETRLADDIHHERTVQKIVDPNGHGTMRLRIVL